MSHRDADRLAYSRDSWTRDLLRLRSDGLSCAPACVVWPGSADEVAEVLDLAARENIPVVPYGAGGSLVGGARPSAGGIVLDLKRMRSVRSFDEVNLRVEVETGIIGERLERQLNARGYTLGHAPPTIGSTTLGGWLATRSAGQLSTRYGKIEDIALGLEVVTPGEVRSTISRPRPADGIDFNALVLGSEGTLAAMTAAHLRVRPLPASRSFAGFRFTSLNAGIEASRRIMQAGLQPAFLRLYDGVDTFVGLVPGTDLRDEVRALDPLTDRAQSLFDELARRVPGLNASGRIAQRMRQALMQGTVKAVMGVPMVVNRALDVLPDDCLLILGFEGRPALVAAELAQASTIAVDAGGTDLGPEPAEEWFKNRHRAPFRQSKVYASGLFIDTFEAVATWDRLLPMYRAVRRAISTDAVVMAHFTHAYTTGSAVTFTFAGRGGEPKDAATGIARYDRVVAQALRAVHETGGSVAHHAGIGEARAAVMDREHGPGGLKILSALKMGMDPAGIMNPGKLGLTALPTSRSRGIPRDPHGFAAAVVAAVGERNVTTSGARTVVKPPDEGALAAVLRVAHLRGMSVSSDQTGFRPASRSVQIDLRRLEGVARISEHAQFVEVEGGVIVHRLEALLQQHNLTLGPLHPRSLLRTVGAALSRNLLIRRSVADGDMGGLCMRVRGLLAGGSVVETRLVPRSATGPDVARVLVGGQGRLGIITKAVLRVRRVPPLVADVCYRLPNLKAALSAARRTLQRDVRPAAARLVPDPIDETADQRHRTPIDPPVRFAVRLVAPSDDHLRAQRTILASAVRDFAATDVGPVAGLAEGGIFDTVVEAPTTWNRAPETVAVARASGCKEVWLDFLAPEGLTLVARVPDADVRRATAAALAAVSAPVIAGAPEQRTSPFEDVIQAMARYLDPGGVFRPRGAS